MNNDNINNYNYNIELFQKLTRNNRKKITLLCNTVIQGKHNFYYNTKVKVIRFTFYCFIFRCFI